MPTLNVRTDRKKMTRRKGQKGERKDSKVSEKDFGRFEKIKKDK